MNTAVILQLQSILGVTRDGKWGPESQAALNDVISVAIPKVAPDAAAFAIDPRSQANIATLLPPVQKIAAELLRSCAAHGIAAKVISGTRSYEEQNNLYAQGRTTGGKIVTNACGGYSNHNFGIAFDIGIFDVNGKYLDESPLYAKAGALGKSLGLEWGGDWKSIQDEPHFELRPDWAMNLSEGDMLASFRARKGEGKEIMA